MTFTASRTLTGKEPPSCFCSCHRVLGHSGLTEGLPEGADIGLSRKGAPICASLNSRQEEQPGQLRGLCPAPKASDGCRLFSAKDAKATGALRPKSRISRSPGAQGEAAFPVTPGAVAEPDWGVPNPRAVGFWDGQASCSSRWKASR